MIRLLLFLLLMFAPVSADLISSGRGLRSSGIVSAGNSTTTPLSSGATYTGTGEQTSYPQVGVMVKADNTGTLYFDFSNDGTNWDSTFPVSGFGVASGVSEFHTAVKLGRYFRVRFVNDTGAQSYMRLTTYYGDGFVPSVAPLNQTAGLDQDAIFVRGTIPQDEIRLGRRSGVTGWNKFGYREGLIATNGDQMIWDSTVNAFTPLTSASTFDITYNAATDGANGGTTGATSLTLYYVDANGLPAVATHALGSDGSDTTSFTGLGINRIAVSASGTNDTNVNNITITDTSAGTTQAIIPAGQGVTQQCLFFVGSNHLAVAKMLWWHASKPSGGNAKILIRGWVYNRSIDTRFEVFRTYINTAVSLDGVIEDPIGFILNSTDTLYFTADTDTNNAEIILRFSLNEYQKI